MGAMKEAIECLGGRGYIPVEQPQVERWQAATGMVLAVETIEVEVRGQAVAGPALAATAARRLAEHPRLPAGEREQIEWLIEVAGLDDPIVASLRLRQTSNRRAAERLALAAVEAAAAGGDLPDEWHSLDAYADCGEPEADAVMTQARRRAEEIAVERGLAVDWYWRRQAR